MDNFLYKDLTFDIIGACFEVYKELESGFFESDDQEALKVELDKRVILFEKEKKIEIYYN